MSDPISVQNVKAHLRLALDSSAEDELIGGLIKTALRSMALYIDRPLTDAACRDPDDAELLDAPLRHAALLMIGDLYENREAQQMVTLNVNMTCQNLMNPYRKLGV